MRNAIVLLALLSFLACSNDENKIESEPLLFGEWQLVERFDGGSLEPNQSVENGYTFTFLQSGIVHTTHPTIGCPDAYEELQGVYSQNNRTDVSTVSLQLECGNEALLIDYEYSFDGEFLLLSELESTCDEGCYNKFKKVGESQVGE